jgi:protein-disulfide isomerase/uncharacterized membrane protein
MSLQRAAIGSLLLSLVGLGICGYLVYLHLGLLRGELLGGVACGGAGAFNCHAVTGGAFGTVLGMPLSVWGLVGYVAVLALALLALQSEAMGRGALTLLTGLALLFVMIDLALLSLMLFVIRVLCPLCLLTYAVNISLLVISWRAVGLGVGQLVRRLPAALRVVVPSGREPATWAFWGMLVLGTAGCVGLHAATSFVSGGPPGSRRERLRASLAKQSPVSVNVTGNPSLGSSDAAFQVVEFSDFFCPSCQRASKMNRIILANHRHDVRFVFKHFPLETSCNDKISRTFQPGACRVAAAAACAHLQGKFWPFHDRIFEQGRDYDPANLEQDAGRLGLDVERFNACMASGKGLEVVRRDIAEAGRLKIFSTPTYVMNGIRMTGVLTPATFEEWVRVLQEREQ